MSSVACGMDTTLVLFHEGEVSTGFIHKPRAAGTRFINHVATEPEGYI